MSHHDNEITPQDSRVIAAAAEGCQESKLLINRRTLMGMTASLFTWAYMPREADARENDQKRLLIVILRGGVDGLYAVPYGNDLRYGGYRTKLSPVVKSLPGEAHFRINAKLNNFLSFYSNNNAAIVHAIAPPLRTRSHFECQFNLESGGRAELLRNVPDGWLNRALQRLQLSTTFKPGDELGLQVGETTLMMRGKAPVLGWSPPMKVRPAYYNDAIEASYGSAGNKKLGTLLKLSNRTQALVGGGDNPDTQMEQAFFGTGRLFGSPKGPRIGVLAVEGWDTHYRQKDLLDAQLAALDGALGKFKAGLDSSEDKTAWAKTVVVCVTEFGRTVRDNGVDGTEHGTGTIALLLGGAVNRRPGAGVITDWPGLEAAKLQDGRDLRATYDLRQLFKTVLNSHVGGLNEGDFSYIFPYLDLPEIDGVKALFGA